MPYGPWNGRMLGRVAEGPGSRLRGRALRRARSRLKLRRALAGLFFDQAERLLDGLGEEEARDAPPGRGEGLRTLRSEWRRLVAAELAERVRAMGEDAPPSRIAPARGRLALSRDALADADL